MTATRTEQPLSDLLADVSLADRQQIESSGATGVADLLSRLPGIEFSRNGGIGASTSLYIRGAETRYAAVFVDGVRVDSQSTGGAPWEALPLALVDRIEVVRGPAAAVYGSDAMGGVVQIFTRKGEQGVRPFASAGIGNQGSRDVSAGISGAQGAWDYSVSVAHARSDGFNARSDETAWGYNPDEDGFTQKSAQARLGLQISQAHRLDGSVLWSDMNAGFDGSATDDDRSKNRLQTASLAWRAHWSEQWRTVLSASNAQARYETVPSPYLADTNVRSYLFQNEYRLGQHHFSAALERREDRLENLDFGRKSRSQNALALGYGLTAGAHTLQAHARYDDDSEFGGKGTGSLAYGYAITPRWRITAAAGTAFRAPTLYQRFSEYGVPSLKPETGRNMEAALRYAEGSNNVSVTVYRNKVRNQITYVSGAGACASSWGCYENTAQARYTGVTLAGATRWAGVNWRASADFQNPKNPETGALLPRRAKRHASLGADTNLAGWLLGAEMQASGTRWDDARNANKLGGYTVWNLYASKELGHGLSMNARVDNLGDKDYATARGYATAGRTFRVGLRWEPDR